MADLGGFDANQVEPSQSFDVIPNGWYEAVITDTERKTAASGNGEYLNVTFTLTQDPYKGRLQWAVLNIWNKSEKAAQIARGQLSAICRAVGVLTPRDSTQLHNLPLLIKIGSEKRENTGEMQNKLKDFKARDAAAPVQASAAQKPSMAAAGNGGAAPWKK